MARYVGYVLGGLALLDGLIGSVAPRWGFQLWEKNRRYFPESWDRFTSEYARLSDPALRYVAIWEMTLAGVILWLASRSKD